MPSNPTDKSPQQAGDTQAASGGSRQMLPLDESIADARTQVHAAIDDAVVDEYVEQVGAGVVFPPVTVFRSEAGTYLGDLGDGFHRVAVHCRAGRTEIAADIRTGNPVDAIWFALGPNRVHGHRLTAADRKHAVEPAARMGTHAVRWIANGIHTRTATRSGAERERPDR